MATRLPERDRIGESSTGLKRPSASPQPACEPSQPFRGRATPKEYKYPDIVMKKLIITALKYFQQFKTKVGYSTSAMTTPVCSPEAVPVLLFSSVSATFTIFSISSHWPNLTSSARANTLIILVENRRSREI